MPRRYLFRIIAGWAFWLMLVGLYAAYQPVLGGLTPKAIRRAVDTVMAFEAIATWPVALSDWLFTWGDGRQCPSTSSSD